MGVVSGEIIEETGKPCGDVLLAERAPEAIVVMEIGSDRKGEKGH